MVKRSSGEQSIFGKEPSIRGEVSRIDLCHALTWYNHFCEAKNCQHWIVDYMAEAGYTDQQISLIRESKVVFAQTWCSVARLKSRGAVFSTKLDEKINEQLEKVRKNRTQMEVEAAFQAQAKAHENPLIERLEIVVDAFLSNVLDSIENIKPVIGSATQQQIKRAIDYYSEISVNLQQVTEDDRAESYDHFSSGRFIEYTQLIGTIVTLLNQENQAVVAEPRKPRKPRKKKEKSASQVLRSFKCSTESKISAEKILGASAMWAYNTKYRKLIKYVASDDRGLGVKGTTITNFSESSTSRTLRKPDHALPKILSENKKVVDKYVESLRVKSQVPRGRTSSDLILLRVFK